MAQPGGSADVKAVADEVVASLRDHRSIPMFSSRPGGLTLGEAYRVTPIVRAAFEARGESIVGRKIGFTNREMWKIYNVQSPIWGYCTTATTRELADTPSVRVTDLVDPRIEPEIIFGLGRAPAPGMDQAALLDCIAWISFGFELVQSIFPQWKFAAPDTVAANGLHGALLIGARHAVTPRKAAWLKELAAFDVVLYRNGEVSQRGSGALVLDSPLLALRHLVDLLATDAHNPPLGADEIITTGTLTAAMPVVTGERWAAKVAGIPFDDIAVAFV